MFGTTDAGTSESVRNVQERWPGGLLLRRTYERSPPLRQPRWGGMTRTLRSAVLPGALLALLVACGSLLVLALAGGLSSDRHLPLSFGASEGSVTLRGTTDSSADADAAPLLPERRTASESRRRTDRIEVAGANASSARPRAAARPRTTLRGTARRHSARAPAAVTPAPASPPVVAPAPAPAPAVEATPAPVSTPAPASTPAPGRPTRRHRRGAKGRHRHDIPAPPAPAPVPAPAPTADPPDPQGPGDGGHRHHGHGYPRHPRR